jgi:putative DNA primase/helicase
MSANGRVIGTTAWGAADDGTQFDPAAYERARTPVSPFKDTDVANGRRFVADHGGMVRFVADWKRWLVFDGRRWVVDASETLVQRLAKQTTDRIAEAADRVAPAAKEVADSETEEDEGGASKALAAARRDLAHAKRSQDMRAVKRMLEAARSEPAVNVQYGRDLFDTHPHLLNCTNGTVDLRTGDLREDRAADFLTKRAPTRFVRGAPRPGYLAFLGKVFHNRPRVASYLREFSGYVATGETCDHSLHIAHGDGANGKSVLLNLWTHVLGEGEYAHTAAAELLVNDGRDRHPTEKVGLRGAHLVVCSETGEDGKLDEPKVKKLTSSDPIDARGMHQDYFQFLPTHTLYGGTNHRPRLKGTDHGVRRRLRLVPFAVRFWKEADRAADPTAEAETRPGGRYDPEFRADPGLEQRLKESEAEGVLADMVEHALRFYAADKALVPPPEVTGATLDYIRSEDLIGQFFDQRVRPDENGAVKAGDFHSAFKAWATAEGTTSGAFPAERSSARKPTSGIRLPSRRASSIVSG